MKNKIKHLFFKIHFFQKEVSLLMILLFVFYTNALGFAQSSVKSDYSNPLLIFGTSFGNYFQVLYKQGKVEEMLNFTSKQSLEKYGRERIENYYRFTSFGYKMKLNSYSINKGVFVLNYRCVIDATDCIIRMPVVVENDTSKFLLPFTIFNQNIFRYN